MKFLRRILSVPETGILIPLVAFIIVFRCVNDSFLSPNSMSAMLRAVAFIGIIAVGQTWLMIAGEIDLSVGSVAGLCAVVASWVMKETGWPLVAGLGAGLATGALVGAINGVVTVRLGVPAFIGTLGMMFTAKGVNYLISSGIPIYPIPQTLKAIGGAEPWGISWAFWVLILVAVIGELCLRKTIWGRCVYATGGNQEVARLAGINTSAVKIGAFILTGLCSATAGMLLMAQLNAGDPVIGGGWELDVIASVVIGGVSLFGGVGTVLGTLLGLVTMQVVRSGLVMSGVKSHWQMVAVGVIMVIAVAFDSMRRRTKMTGSTPKG
jgi:ribose transport system permease protein